MRKLNKQQFKQVAGKKLDDKTFCIPVLDADGNMVILDEVAATLNVNLPAKSHKPIIIRRDKSENLPPKKPNARTK